MGAYTGRPGVDWGDIAQGMGNELKLRDYMDTQAAQAIRWQGEQDYRTLIDSGVDPEEAMRRAAPKLFHNDPRALASAVEGMGRKQDRIAAAFQANEWRRQNQQENRYESNLALEDTRAAQAERQAAALAAKTKLDDFVMVKGTDANGNDITYRVPTAKFNANQARELVKQYETEIGKNWWFRSDPKVEEYRKKLADLGFDPTGNPLGTQQGAAPGQAVSPPAASSPSQNPYGATNQSPVPTRKSIAAVQANPSPVNKAGFEKLFGKEELNKAFPTNTPMVAPPRTNAPTITPAPTPVSMAPPRPTADELEAIRTDLGARDVFAKKYGESELSKWLEILKGRSTSTVRR